LAEAGRSAHRCKALQRGIEVAVACAYGRGYSAVMRPRKDHETATLIDESLDALRFHGMYVALRMLLEAGVRPNLAFRVLQEPDKRRACRKPTLQ
jgi:hypothetical protein